MKYRLCLFSSFCYFKKGWCLFQAKVCAQNTGKPLSQAYPGKSVVRLTDRQDMTIAVDWDIKPHKSKKYRLKQYFDKSLTYYLGSM